MLYKKDAQLIGHCVAYNNNFAMILLKKVNIFVILGRISAPYRTDA